MGKIGDLFKKIRDTKGTFHAKIGSIKDRNGMDLTEAVNIKKRQQEYTEELYKKDLHDQDNHDGVITHLEPDILECEVNWALESTLSDIHHSRILYDPPPRILEIKANINKLDLIKIKSLCTTKETISKVKRQPSEWEKIIAN